MLPRHSAPGQYLVAITHVQNGNGALAEGLATNGGKRQPAADYGEPRLEKCLRRQYLPCYCQLRTEMHLSEKPTFLQHPSPIDKSTIRRLLVQVTRSAFPVTNRWNLVGLPNRLRQFVGRWVSRQSLGGAPSQVRKAPAESGCKKVNSPPPMEARSEELISSCNGCRQRRLTETVAG